MSNTDGKKIISGMFWRFGEKITAQGVSLVVSIILARLLMPSDYGVVAIVNIFIMIAEVLVTNGLGVSLIQKKEVGEKEFSTLFWLNLGLSIIIYICFFFISPVIAHFYDKPILTPVLRVFAIRIPLNAINSIQNAYISRNMDFKKFFYATSIGTVISAFVGIYLAYKGYGVWALVAQMLTNTVIDTGVLALVIKWHPQFHFSIKEAKPLLSYGWKILATDLIGTIFNYLNDFIIGKKYSSEDLAYYSKGKKFPELISTNIGATLSSVLFPAMSLSSGIEDIVRIRRKSLKLMEYIIFPLMLGMFTVADNMVLVLLSEKWLFSVIYVRISCITAVIGVLGTTLIQEIKAIGRSDITLKLELIKKPIYLIIAIIAMFISVEAIAYSVILVTIIGFCFNVYPVKKLIGFDFSTHIKDALPTFAMSLVMCIVIYLVEYIIKNKVVCLVSQIVIGCLIYIILSIISKNDSFIYLKNLAKTKLKRGKHIS